MSNKYECRRCLLVTEHTHAHDAPHGIEGAHMAGSERFVCDACGLTTRASDGQSGFKFVLDVVPR